MKLMHCLKHQESVVAQGKLIFMQLNMYKLSDSKPIYASEARKRLLLGGALHLIDLPGS